MAITPLGGGDSYTSMKFSEMAMMAQSAFASMYAPLAGMGGTVNPMGYTAPAYALPNPANYAGGFAKGGRLIATRPTTATFGESGPELVQFTPLSSIGRGVGSVTGDMNGKNSQTKIILDMSLSPDLEARVVSKAMDGTAEVVQKINRSK